MKVLERKDHIEELGGHAAFVVHDEPELIRRSMLHGLDVVFPVLVDPDRSAYREWGLRRASFPRVYLDPAVWLRYAGLLLGGKERWRGQGRDTLQLGGDFIVDAAGRIAYARPQRRDDRPPVGELLEAMRSAAS